MADILSPEEIEALLTSLAGDAGDVAPSDDIPDLGGAAGRTPSRPPTIPAQYTDGSVSFEIYDFRRPDKLSKDQIRKLQMLHETCARQASSSLAAYLRTPVHVELISVDQVPYEEYLRSINQSVFSILSLAPLSGQAVLEMEFGLVFTMIDRMLGGPGKTVTRVSLSEIERPLCLQLIERVLQSLKNAWEAVVIVNPEVETIETSSQFVQIATPNDIAVTILFEVKVGNQRGAMSLCIPYLVLKPITQKLSAQKWISTSGRKRTDNTRKLLAKQVCGTKVPCSVELGTATLNIGQFVGLRPGDVVRLDQTREQDLKMNIVGKPKYLGQPAMRGNKLVFRVTDRLD